MKTVQLLILIIFAFSPLYPKSFDYKEIVKEQKITSDSTEMLSLIKSLIKYTSMYHNEIIREDIVMLVNFQMNQNDEMLRIEFMSTQEIPFKNSFELFVQETIKLTLSKKSNSLAGRKITFPMTFTNLDKTASIEGGITENLEELIMEKHDENLFELGEILHCVYFDSKK